MPDHNAQGKGNRDRAGPSANTVPVLEQQAIVSAKADGFLGPTLAVSREQPFGAFES